jgi:hypothetical protein
VKPTPNQVGVLAMTFVIGACVGAMCCKGALPAAAESTYYTEQMECVDVSRDWTEYRNCVGAVKAKWAPKDAGACESCAVPPPKGDASDAR